MVVSPTLPLSSFFVRGKNLNKLIRAAHIGKKSDCVSSAFCFFLLLVCFLSFWICFQYYSAYHSKVIYRWRKCTTVVVVAFINIIGLHEKWVFVRMSICLSMCSVVRLVEAKKKRSWPFIRDSLISTSIFQTLHDDLHWAVPLLYKCYMYGQGNAHNSLWFFICIQSEQKKSGHTFFLSLK